MARGHQAIESQQKNAAKAAKDKKATGPKVDPATLLVHCAFCKAPQQQLSKVPEVALQKLQQHVDGHKGKTMGECFPDFTPAALALKAAAVPKAAEFKADKPKMEKKVATHKRH